MSVFVLDASYALMWCFPDRSTPNTDEALRRMEARVDRAVVPWVWQLEVGNALGKAAVKGKVSLRRARNLGRTAVSANSPGGRRQYPPTYAARRKARPVAL